MLMVQTLVDHNFIKLSVKAIDTPLDSKLGVGYCVAEYNGGLDALLPLVVVRELNKFFQGGGIVND